MQANTSQRKMKKLWKYNNTLSKLLNNCRGEAKPRPLTATFLASSQKLQRRGKAEAILSNLSEKTGSKQKKTKEATRTTGRKQCESQTAWLRLPSISTRFPFSYYTGFFLRSYWLLKTP